MSKRISRSTFLKGISGLVLAAAAGKLCFDTYKRNAAIESRLLGPSMARGHRLRDGKTAFRSDTSPVEETEVAIVGGGIAGLSAGWWLQRNHLDDFRVLELEPHVGGNSASGKNSVSAYPWGAHYVPLANEESEYVHILFKELGVVESADKGSGLPVYNDLYLCHAPQERLFKDGRFEEGLVPKRGLKPRDENQLADFFNLIKRYRAATGADGRPAFAIPLALSSADEQFRSLDRISMAQWMQDNGFDSRPLLWYVNYCCRDDYGSTLENVSAWAGIHYFSGRRGRAANAEMNSVVTWPEGNGFLVEQLRRRLQGKITTGAMVTAVEESDDRLLLTCADADGGAPKVVSARCVVFAAPRFIASHVLKVEGAGRHFVPELVYSPWLVANLTLSRFPEKGLTTLAWDNVSYTSDSLGYVVATHQDITTRPAATVLTYYYPLSAGDPGDARRQLAATSAERWTESIVADLEKMHPGIAAYIRSIDVWPWGHGMIRPSVGFIWGDSRARMQESLGNIFFAHSDMSGISNFEESQYHGVEAARKVLDCLREA